MSLLPSFQRACAQYAATKHAAMDLGVRKKAAILTCMDSRLFPELMLGLHQGDCEVLRNGGGRVTDDVIRSLIVCTRLLHCNELYIIHHTNCGAQNAIRDIGITVEHAKAALGALLHADLGGRDMKPIISHTAALHEDVAAVRGHADLQHLQVVGLLFDSHSANLEVVVGPE